VEVLEVRAVPAVVLAAAGAGSPPQVRVYDGPGGAAVREFPAFDPAFTGGVRAAAGDFTADGVADLVVGTGPGRPTRVRVLDGKTQDQIFAVDPFESAFTGGVYVAAGDLTGDGVPDLVITPDEAGGPRCRVFDGRDFGQVADFFGIDDPAFRGGARPAVGDVTGDGIGDLVVAAGFGGGPRVAVWDGASAAGGAFARRAVGDFFAFEPGLRNGVYAAAGDLTGDGVADLVFGAGPGGGPRVLALSGRELAAGGGDPGVVLNLFAGDPGLRGGVRVAVADVDGDGRGDVLTGAGAGGDGGLRAYRGADGGVVTDLRPFPAPPAGGVFVAGDATAAGPGDGPAPPPDPQPGPPPTPAPVPSPVTVNGVTLTRDDWEALRQRFNLPADAAGRFWYDNATGAVGREGAGTGTFLAAGLNLGGPLRADASSGTSGVFVNGRQLTPGEVAFLQGVLGGPIPPGRYAVDAAGNAGPEGQPPVVNLVAAYNQRREAIDADPTLRGRSPLTTWDIVGRVWS
jgi:hypothetical protein